MKKIRIIILFLTIFNIAVFAYSYTVTENTFSIEFPGKPEKSEYSMPITNTEFPGEIKTIAYSFNQYLPNQPTIMYTATRAQSPKGTFTSHSVKEVLDMGANSLPENAQAKDISISNYPGKEIIISPQDTDSYIIIRMYIVEDTSYQIQVMTAKSLENKPEIKNFLNSFKLVK